MNAPWKGDLQESLHPFVVLTATTVAFLTLAWIFLGASPSREFGAFEIKGHFLYSQETPSFSDDQGVYIVLSEHSGKQFFVRKDEENPAWQTYKNLQEGDKITLTCEQRSREANLLQCR